MMGVTGISFNCTLIYLKKINDYYIVNTMLEFSVKY